MKKLLYIFDDINYLSGARKVTEYQIKLISDKYATSVFSLTRPSLEIEAELENVKFIDVKIWDNTKVLGLSLREAMKSNTISIRKKILRLLYSLFMRLNMESFFMKRCMLKNTIENLNSFDIICIVSESSKLRKIVAKLSKPKKIQWIHTDYYQWSNFSKWTSHVTVNDEKIYNKFDYIVTLSEKNKIGFLKKLPNLKEKTIVIPNLIPAEEIIKKSNEPLEIELNKNVTNLITVGRIDKEKAFERLLKICKHLKEDGLLFNWYIVGNGPLFKHINKIIDNEHLNNEIFMLGHLDNPYPLIKQCDIFALLSEYEGTPVTIDEAMILGTYIIATNVGGISEQLNKSTHYVVVKNDEKEIYNQLKILINNLSKQKENKEEIERYILKNTTILNELIKYFDQ